MPNDVWRFLRDPNEQKRYANALTDVANRGLLAGTFGAPVDLATQAANLLVAGAGYTGHKLGLLSQPPSLIDPASVPGSSEWIGNKMQRAGLLGDYRNPIAELGTAMLSPVAMKGAVKAGGLLAQADLAGAENAAKVSPMGPISKQRGALVFHGTNAQIPDGGNFDLSKVGSGARAQTEGWGGYFSESKENARKFGKNIYKMDIPDNYLAELFIPRGGPSKANPEVLDKIRFALDAGSQDARVIGRNANNWIKVNTRGGFVSDGDKKIAKALQRAFVQTSSGFELDANQAMNAIKNSGAEDYKIKNAISQILSADFMSMGDTTVYNAIAAKNRFGQRETSLFLNDMGISGLGTSAASDLHAVNPNATNYVIWDQDLLNSAPMIRVK